MITAELAWVFAGLCLVGSLVGFLKWEGWLLTVVWVALAMGVLA